MKSRIVELWSGVFYVLSWISWFKLIQALFPATKEDCLFSIEGNNIGRDLNKGVISKELKEVFRSKRFALSDNATVRKEKNEKWEITTNKETYVIKKECGTLKIYRPNYGFVDMWVLGNLVFSLVCLSVSSVPQIQWWEIILLSYAGIQIFEIVIYQINVLLFDQRRAEKAGKKYALGGYRRIVILLLHNYVEILFWFALFYRNFDFLFDSKYISLNSFSGSSYFSLATMSTLGYGDIIPTNTTGAILCFFQTSIGILMALLIIARFISLLPRPKTLDEYER
jgi:hypothetical protein